MLLKGNNYRVNIHKKLSLVGLRFIIGYFLLSVFLIAAGNYKEDGIRRRGWNRTIEEIKQMSPLNINQAIGVATFLSILTAFGFYVTQKEKGIITSFSFSDESQEVTFLTEKIFTTQITEERVRYNELKCSYDNSLDLLNGKIYKVIKFGNKTSGNNYLFKEHPTWNSNDFNIIKDKIITLVNIQE